MKKKWFLVPVMAVALASCEKQEQAVPPATPTAEKKIPAPTKIEPAADTAPANPPAPADPSGAASNATENPPGATGTTPAPPSSPPPGDGIPVAKSVEGQPGFVFSPYNDKVIDVRNMPPGTLVADPTFPASEKKHFRLPP